MDQNQIHKICINLPACTFDEKETWGAILYRVDGKMFAFVGDHKNGRPIVTLKGDPDENEALRKTHEDIIPGYYANKVHWNSIFLDGTVPDTLIENLVVQAHACLVSGFSKKRQSEILK